MVAQMPAGGKKSGTRSGLSSRVDELREQIPATYADPCLLFVTIRGLKPLVQRVALPEEMKIVDHRPVPAFNIPAGELVLKRMHRTPDGKPCLGHVKIMGALVKAGCGVKSGRAWVTTTYASGRTKECRLFRYFRLLGTPFPLVDPDDPRRPARWKFTYLPIPRRSDELLDPCPMFERWLALVTCCFDQRRVSEETLQVLFDRAGGLGMGAGNMFCGQSPQYGTFEIIGWESHQ